ncbi:response regulator transcription factor [Nocardia sp. NPDC049190]|uniref:response regulator transcription factor n=1 Tax=Nocardia sp. NPDC049190 TaxID=3155650 RepID=UPI0033EE5A44
MVHWAELLRCFIVDDSVHFLDAARELLEREGVTVVGVASTSAEALRGVEALRPDVTLVDVDLGEENGFELAEHLYRTGWPAPSPVILTSTHAEQEFADLIVKSPAVGFLSKFAVSSGAIRELLTTHGVGRPDDALSERRGT